MKSFILTVVALVCFSGLSRACDYRVGAIRGCPQPVLAIQSSYGYQSSYQAGLALRAELAQAEYNAKLRANLQADYDAMIAAQLAAKQRAAQLRAFQGYSAPLPVSSGFIQQNTVERRGLFGRLRVRSSQTIIAP